MEAFLELWARIFDDMCRVIAASLRELFRLS